MRGRGWSGVWAPGSTIEGTACLAWMCVQGDLKTFTPSSFRYEDQVEVRLPLATLWVVLRNELLKAGRCHADVDVGWPATVRDGHVALQAIPSSRQQSPWPGVRRRSPL